jgi:hypothetical protein
MPTYPRDQETNPGAQVAPVKVQIVNDQRAPVERRSQLSTYVPSATPFCILPLSNKRIQAIVSVVPIATGNTGQAYITKDQAGALQVSATYNAGAIIGPGTFTMVGTGELWLVSNGTTNYLVSVIAEYEV